MRIKFTEDHIGSDGTHYKKGQEYDAQNTTRAAIWVRAGMAKAVDAEAKQVVAEVPGTAAVTPAAKK